MSLSSASYDREAQNLGDRCNDPNSSSVAHAAPTQSLSVCTSPAKNFVMPF